MELVYLLLLKSLQTSDVLFGTGIRRSAWNAQNTGSKILKVYALQSQTIVKCSTLQANVQTVMMATDLTTEFVSLLLLKNLQISDVELGTGRTKNA